MSNKFLIAVLGLLAAVSAVSAQDHIETFSHNTDFRGTARSLQYTPTSDGYISSKNGLNLYTRALYGSHSLWRLETSDRPIFAAYHKKDNRNISFAISTPDGSLRLDSTASCTSLYRGGERIYTLTDPAWGAGEVVITAVADHDSEAAYWQILTKDMPKGSVLTAHCCPTVKIKINRSGDMGADPANCFAPDPSSSDTEECSIKIGGKSTQAYIMYADRKLYSANQPQLEAAYDKALADTRALAARITINTPDPYVNTLGANLAAAADGIWDGLTYQHGAIGWRMPLSGWRGAYTGDFLGWHDRARTHFDAYAASQVTDMPPTIPHPAQDSLLNCARALKAWGTQMYSEGYICRNPQKNNVMHHYDMNLCYIDELLWHLQWTGDTAYARAIWPVIERSLAWEKRNYDPDDDGLYDAYCCIWASDALYYNSGAVTHSTAYNYRANLLASQVAALIGVDPAPYAKEAEKILNALNSVLWLNDKGVWAEHCDLMGKRQLHTHPALWTVYHAIDSHTATPEQAYRATRYIDANIPHIPVEADGLDPDGGYTVVSTTDWLPYAWSINNVAFAEIYHTALAYWQAGRADDAFKLLKSAMLDGMYIGNSPGNIGQISHYDAARGECYRDFADPVGMMSRALVQGLFGFSPSLLSRSVALRPGFPESWEWASIDHPDFSLDFTTEKDPDSHRVSEIYKLKLNPQMAASTDSIEITLPLRYADMEVTAASIPVTDMRRCDVGTPYQTLRIVMPTGASADISFTVTHGEERMPYSPLPAVRYADIPQPLGVEPVEGCCLPVDSSLVPYNANVADIFSNRYLTPRSPYTTLQLPLNGIGEWCHPVDSAYIDDAILRNSGGTIAVGDLVFNVPSGDANIAYTSLYDNYPDSITFCLSGSGKALALLMAGSTNHMQAYVPNATLIVKYTDGTTCDMALVPPYNWSPIEQDYFCDGKAFDIPTPRQLRVSLLDGTASTHLGSDLGIEGVYGRRIPGGAANVIYLPIDPDKQLSSLTLRADANEVVIGIIAATLISDNQ